MAPPKKKKPTATEVVKEIKRRTRRVFTSEEKIKIVLEGLRGENYFEDAQIALIPCLRLNCADARRLSRGLLLVFLQTQEYPFSFMLYPK